MSSKTTVNASRLAWMSAIIANFIQLLPYNFKPAKLSPGLGPGNLFLPNKMVQPRLADRPTKGFQFIPHSLGSQLDCAVRQIADGARHLEASRDRLDAVTKTDTLHTARVKNLHSPSIHSIHPRQ